MVGFRRCRKVSGFAIDVVGIHRFFEGEPLGLLGTQPLFDVIKSFFQGAHPRFDVLFDLDDVVAEGGFNEIADISRLHVEGCVFKRFDHRATREIAEAAAFDGTGLVVRFQFCQVGEVFTAFDLLEDI